MAKFALLLALFGAVEMFQVHTQKFGGFCLVVGLVIFAVSAINAG